MGESVKNNTKQAKQQPDREEDEAAEKKMRRERKRRSFGRRLSVPVVAVASHLMLGSPGDGDHHLLMPGP